MYRVGVPTKPAYAAKRLCSSETTRSRPKPGFSRATRSAHSSSRVSSTSLSAERPHAWPTTQRTGVLGSPCFISTTAFSVAPCGPWLTPLPSCTRPGLQAGLQLKHTKCELVLVGGCAGVGLCSLCPGPILVDDSGADRIARHGQFEFLGPPSGTRLSAPSTRGSARKLSGLSWSALLY